MKISNNALSMLIKAYRSVLKHARIAQFKASFIANRSTRLAGAAIVSTLLTLGAGTASAADTVYIDETVKESTAIEGSEILLRVTEGNDAYGVKFSKDEGSFETSLSSSSGDIIIDSHGKSAAAFSESGLKDGEKSTEVTGSFTANSAANLYLLAHQSGEQQEAFGLKMKSDIDVSLKAQEMAIIASEVHDAVNINGANQGDLQISGKGIAVIGAQDAIDSNAGTGNITLDAGSQGIYLYSKDEAEGGYAALSHTGSGDVRLTSDGAIVLESEKNHGLRLVDNASGTFRAEGTSTIFKGGENGVDFRNAANQAKISSTGLNEFIGESGSGINLADLDPSASFTAEGESNFLFGSNAALSLANQALATLKAAKLNVLVSNLTGLSAAGAGASAVLEAQHNLVGGTDYAVLGSNGASIHLKAEGNNLIGFEDAFEGNDYYTFNVSEKELPSTPAEPEVPTHPDGGNEGNDSTDPSVPGEGDNSNGGESEVPVTPIEPSEPTEPEPPENGGDENNSGLDPSVPGDGEDNNGNEPDVPMTPIEPSEPVEPEFPDNGGDEGNGETDPIIPGDGNDNNESKPEVPVIPIEPADPTVPTTPIEPADPTIPATPIEPAEPVDPEFPDHGGDWDNDDDHEDGKLPWNPDHDDDKWDDDDHDRPNFPGHDDDFDDNDHPDFPGHDNDWDDDDTHENGKLPWNPDLDDDKWDDDDHDRPNSPGHDEAFDDNDRPAIPGHDNDWEDNDDLDDGKFPWKPDHDDDKWDDDDHDRPNFPGHDDDFDNNDRPALPGHDWDDEDDREDVKFPWNPDHNDGKWDDNHEHRFPDQDHDADEDRWENDDRLPGKPDHKFDGNQGSSQPGFNGGMRPHLGDHAVVVVRPGFTGPHFDVVKHGKPGSSVVFIKPGILSGKLQAGHAVIVVKPGNKFEVIKPGIPGHGAVFIKPGRDFDLADKSFPWDKTDGRQPDFDHEADRPADKDEAAERAELNYKDNGDRRDEADSSKPENDKSADCGHDRNEDKFWDQKHQDQRAAAAVRPMMAAAAPAVMSLEVENTVSAEVETAAEAEDTSNAAAADESTADNAAADSTGYDYSLSTDTEEGFTYKGAIAKVGIKADSGSAQLYEAGESNLITAALTGIEAAGEGSAVTLTAGQSNSISVGANGSETAGTIYAINAENGAKVALKARNNELTSAGRGIKAVSAEADLEAQYSNIILAGRIAKWPLSDETDLTLDFGSLAAVYAQNGAQVNLHAGGSNYLAGTIFAQGRGTEVSLGVLEDGSVTNYVVSQGSFVSDPEDPKSKEITTAIYSKDGAKTVIKAGSEGANYIATYLDFGDRLEERAADEGVGLTERTVWADKGGEIVIDGTSYIFASRAGYNTSYEELDPDANQGVNNSIGIALAAGTEKISADSADLLTETAEKLSTITVNYGQDSMIIGDIVAGLNGYVDLNAKAGGTLNLTGNVLAGNGGRVDLELGEDSAWIGRADDYNDANLDEHISFYDPAFSSEILSSGTVNLSLGQGATWFVNGQSWISSVTGPVSGKASIVLSNTLASDGNLINSSSSALTIGQIEGSNISFEMTLDENRYESNMLYIKQGSGHYTINLTKPISEADIQSSAVTDDGSEIFFDGLRFATVGAGSSITFDVVSRDQGMYDISYDVYYDEYDGNAENVFYNADKLTSEKPGDENVSNYFKASRAMSLAAVPAAYSEEAEEKSAEPEVLSAEDPEADPAVSSQKQSYRQTDGNYDRTTNIKIGTTRQVTLSSAGQTVVNMSKANYTMAVYMDTLNKRQGASRINLSGEDDGIWLRVRHDNIGRDYAYRIHNTMLELGYDFKHEFDGGLWHFGAAADYMRGSVDYRNVNGDGDLDRYGAWLYATCYADEGWYADFVLKYGHLKNDFSVSTKTSGTKVSGDYDNDVLSLSAEVGYKLASAEGWFIEPQAQLQYSYLTSADYTTSQGTAVELEAIDSLIGRAGMRLGFEDLSAKTPLSIYLRADVLKEFLGDQKVEAADVTGTFSETFDNDECYFDIGLGLSVKPFGKTHLYVEAEQILGADYDDSYIFSAGFKTVF